MATSAVFALKVYGASDQNKLYHHIQSQSKVWNLIDQNNCETIPLNLVPLSARCKVHPAQLNLLLGWYLHFLSFAIRENSNFIATSFQISSGSSKVSWTCCYVHICTPCPCRLCKNIFQRFLLCSKGEISLSSLFISSCWLLWMKGCLRKSRKADYRQRSILLAASKSNWPLWWHPRSLSRVALPGSNWFVFGFGRLGNNNNVVSETGAW